MFESKSKKAQQFEAFGKDADALTGRYREWAGRFDAALDGLEDVLGELEALDGQWEENGRALGSLLRFYGMPRLDYRQSSPYAKAAKAAHEAPHTLVGRMYPMLAGVPKAVIGAARACIRRRDSLRAAVPREESFREFESSYPHAAPMRVYVPGQGAYYGVTHVPTGNEAISETIKKGTQYEGRHY